MNTKLSMGTEVERIGVAPPNKADEEKMKLKVNKYLTLIIMFRLPYLR